MLRLSSTGRLAAQLGLPVLVGVLIATQFTTKGTFDWRNSIYSDLDVYVTAAARLLAGDRLYQVRGGELPWLYHPMAAVLFVPLLVFGRAAQWYVWAGVNAALVFFVARRFGVVGWRTTLVSTAALLLMWPITHSFHLGQIGVLVMALVVADWRGRGVGTGLATVVKLTPGLFAVAAACSNRWREAIYAFIVFAAVTGTGWLWRPDDTVEFWRSLVNPIREVSELARVGNQSMMGAWLRAFGLESYSLGLVASLAIAVVGLGAAVWTHRRGHRDLALCVVGFASLLAAPLSWAHQFVWVLPLAIVAIRGRHLSARLRVASLTVVVWLCAGQYDALPLGAYIGASNNMLGALVANLTIPIVLGWFLIVALERPSSERPSSVPV